MDSSEKGMTAPLAELHSRFTKDEKRNAHFELIRQELVQGSADIVQDLLKHGHIEAFSPGDKLIAQGEYSCDIYFILAGAVQLEINGVQTKIRERGTHVGEMALIEPSLARSATVIAKENTICLKVEESAFTEIACRFPEIWRQLACILARRLKDRNSDITPRNKKPRVFVISSVESLDIARAIQDHFDHDETFVEIWTDNTFRASQYPLESLETKLASADFAIAIAQPDDNVETRNQRWPVMRDNVVFELGFFIGRLGRRRAFLIEPRSNELKLPSDLSGLTTLSYHWSGDQRDLVSSLSTVCNTIRKEIAEQGCR